MWRHARWRRHVSLGCVIAFLLPGRCYNHSVSGEGERKWCGAVMKKRRRRRDTKVVFLGWKEGARLIYYITDKKKKSWTAQVLSNRGHSWWHNVCFIHKDYIVHKATGYFSRPKNLRNSNLELNTTKVQTAKNEQWSFVNEVKWHFLKTWNVRTLTSVNGWAETTQK